MTELVYQGDVCTSELQVLWVTLLYTLKAALLLLGAYLTFQTRHVTLPTLRDTRNAYTIILIVVSMAMVSLPVLLVSRVGHAVKYAVSALVLLIVIGTTLTLTFVPKVRVPASVSCFMQGPRGGTSAELFLRKTLSRKVDFEDFRALGFAFELQTLTLNPDPPCVTNSDDYSFVIAFTVSKNT